VRGASLTVKSRNEILNKLRAIVEPYIQDETALDDIREETHLIEDLNIDSLNLVDIIIDVEAAFGIEIDDDAAEQMRTVGAAVSVIQERIRKKQSRTGNGRPTATANDSA